MSKLVTAWQRRPMTFALSLAWLTVLGLVVMLADAGTWKLAGFTCACLPVAFAGVACMKQRSRQRD